ncbi:uncharacterized protein LOC124162147 [Ischnura elegans]|uniref:uncharacterized protein LOC124162147 n=1 Tax=Ischnura elegans TaxID=197161 RepID=UPI001ED87E46|nr:uncharacterized protein LOC124162147 [Ischnura elegans]
MTSNFVHFSNVRRPSQFTGIISDGATLDTDKVDSIIWTDEQVFRLIELRAKYAQLFTGRKGSAPIAYGKVAEELGIGGNFVSVKKKWENLLDKYKKDKIARMNMSMADGEKSCHVWKYFDAMDNFMKAYRSDSPNIRRPKLPPVILAAEMDPKSSSYYQDGQADISSWMLPEEEAEETAVEGQVENHGEEEKDFVEDNMGFLYTRQGNSREEVVHPCKRHKSDKGTQVKEGRRSHGHDFALGIAMAKLKQISESAAQDAEKLSEFDLWAKSVATQLNAMEITRALRLQLKLQTMVTEERLLYESSHQ